MQQNTAIKDYSCNYRRQSMGIRTDSNRTSRCSGFLQTNPNRCIKTSATSIEALLRWSLTRDMLRAGSSISFMMFTVIQEAIHATFTQIKNETLETKQWIFTSETPFEEVMTEIQSVIDPCLRCYFFTPSRKILQTLSPTHPGRCLTREQLSKTFPCATTIMVDSIAKPAHHVMPRMIGADTRHWLKQLMSSPITSDIHDSVINEFLTSAARTDSAMILRLFVTPTAAWM